MDFPLRSGDVSIRPMRDDDADYTLMLRWLTDEKITEFYGGRDVQRTIDTVRELYRPRILGDVTVTPCIIEYQSMPVGYIQFYETKDHLKKDLDPLLSEPHVFGMDTFIGEHERWGKGIGSTALRMLSDHLLQSTGATAVIVDPNIDNDRAIRTYEKAGFEKIRRLPGYETHEDELKDWWLMIRKK